MDEHAAEFSAGILDDEMDIAPDRIAVPVIFRNAGKRVILSATAFVQNQDREGDQVYVKFGTMRPGESSTQTARLHGWPDSVFFTAWYSDTVSRSGGGMKKNMRHITLTA